MGMKSRFHLFMYSSLIVFMTWLVLGCPPAQTRVGIALNATNKLNPDAGGQSLSVVVRIYQLKDKGRMETADYNAIWKSDKETLSDDMLERQERVLQPGTQELLELQPNASASYLGVVALFRNPSGDNWRKIIPLNKGKIQRIAITLNEQMIDVTSTVK
jgi:type VI secretion system protein VasD